MITEENKQHLNNLTFKQKEALKNRFLESYKEGLKEIKGYSGIGLKLPQGLATKKPIKYKFKVSKKEATTQRKRDYFLNAIGLSNYSDNYKTISKQLDIVEYCFKEDREILKILQKIKEVLKNG